MNFSEVKYIKISEGVVLKITINGELVWQANDDTTAKLGVAKLGTMKLGV